MVFLNRQRILMADEQVDSEIGSDSEVYDDSYEPDIGDVKEVSFGRYSDDELIELIRAHDNKEALDYLFNKYRRLVKLKARAYFLVGADREDIIQEGMIGFFKGIRDYRIEKQSSFRVFAEMCITRQIITAIKTATRQKHIPLNSYISLNKPIYDEDSDRTFIDILPGVGVNDPEEQLISHEEFEDIEKNMGKILSELEWSVLTSYLDGKSYQEIAAELNRHVKSIDNALQRVKRKLEKYMESRGDDVDINTVYRGLKMINRHMRGA